jgi:hypothetical protein
MENPMAQYHRPVCIEAEERLNTYDFDCGAKDGERSASTVPTQSTQ